MADPNAQRIEESPPVDMEQEERGLARAGVSAEFPSDSESESESEPAAFKGMLTHLVGGEIGSLNEFARQRSLTLEQLADWMAEPARREHAANLITLGDFQAQLLVCQHRAHIAARLVEVAGSATSPETVRRACADLLKVRLIDPYKENRLKPSLRPRKPRLTERILMQALERLGRIDEGP